MKFENKSNLLRIDLDIVTKPKAINLLWHRLEFLDRKDFLSLKMITKIELNYKKTYGCKIYLKKYYDLNFISMLQLLLGSDYKKETLAIINHNKYKMYYSDRLFDLKRYPNGNIKISKKFEVTDIIFLKIKKYKDRLKLLIKNNSKNKKNENEK